MNITGFGNLFKSVDEQLDPVPTPENFARVVVLIVERYHLTHFDAIMALCDHEHREYESVKTLLTPKIKLALLNELSGLRLLKDRSFLQHKLG